MTPLPPSAFVHLSAAGVSLLLDVTDGRLPAVLHWGAALGALTEPEVRALAVANVPPRVPNTMDDPVRLAILPEHHTGWSGRPGLAGHRAGADWSPKFEVVSLEFGGTPVAGSFVEVGPGLLTTRAQDATAQLALTLEVELLPSGLVRTRATVTSTAGAGDAPYDVSDLALALPTPGRAREILDFAGRWGKERTPQRRPLGVGIHEREGRKGRTGADAATVLSVGEPGFGFRRGEVWGVHVAWSGNHRHYAERLFTGAQVLGGGELLLPGEVRLGSGDGYTSPWLYGAYGDGLDEQAARFHRYLRARDRHPVRPRPVTLNVWEAVYFDHDLARLTDLADRAAAVGVERYVLDDGWFRHRRSDRAGLGDWYVDEDVWPDGLSPLVDRVTALGMEFGLWFEPEMINEDSDLARAHPEWILQTGDRLPVRARHQQVLNLGLPEAFDHVLERMTAILDEYDIAYIKWDHNRDLVDAGTWPTGVAGVHEQTLAAYRLMATLKERFPGLEIEACASGGARVDLGVIEHTDRVWVSDCIDPLERQEMVRWTTQLLPPELLGAHIASGVSHTTGRSHALSFRAGTALFGHLGIEWDLVAATDAELRDLASWVALYRAERHLLHTGDVVRADSADDSLHVYGTVAQDRADALFFLAFTGRAEVSPRGRFTLPGLAPSVLYRVAPVVVAAEPEPGLGWPAWAAAAAAGAAGAAATAGAAGAAGVAAPDVARVDAPGVVLSGRVLAEVGLQAPASFPDRVVILRVTAEPQA